MNVYNERDISLDVYKGDKLAGVLTRCPRADGKESLYRFTYNSGYSGPELPTLPMGQGPIQSQGLHNFFDNLVPESGWMQDSYLKILEAYGFPPSCFFALALCGKDISGDLCILSRDDLLQKKIKELNNGALFIALNKALLSGKQPKCMVVKNASGEFEPSSPDNPSNYLAKFFPSNYVYSDSMVEGVGFGGEEPKAPDFSRTLIWEFAGTIAMDMLLPDDQTCEVELRRVKGIDTEAFLSKRFDRNPTRAVYGFGVLLGKKPEEKYCASYAEMADYIRSHADGKHKDGIKTNIKDIDVLFKRIVAMTLIGNGDSHLNNFSLMDNGTEFRLAPNYDIVPLISHEEFGKNALMIGVHKGRNYSAPTTDGRAIPPRKHLEARHLVDLAMDMGILSKTPTHEEKEHFYALVNEMNEQAKKASVALKYVDIHQFPILEKLKDRRFKNERNALSEYIEKRRHSTLDGVPAALAKKLRHQEASRRSAIKSAARYTPALKPA